MKIDIIKDSNDPFARYTMPRAAVVLEGRSTNTRTLVTNLAAISQALKRPPAFLLKYMAYERGTKAEVKHDKFMLRGTFTAGDVQEMIYKYIGDYVLCPDCNNPETYFEVEKAVVMKCYACGKRNKVERGKIYNMIEKELGETRDRNYGQAGNADGEGAILSAGDREAAILSAGAGVKTCGDLEKFIGALKGDEYKMLLGGLEMNEQGSEVSRIAENVKYLIDNKVVRKIDCLRYFQAKSKYVGKEDSGRIREVMKVFFQN